jgi:SanA protein
MRKALQAEGVPAHAIFTDHAGFNTRASMVRAREVFKVKSAIVVTQGFHMTRALYLADRAGLTANGVTADLHPYGRQGQKSTIREIPARFKAFGSALFSTHVLLGPVLPITGDGRTSWGPQNPPR